VYTDLCNFLSKGNQKKSLSSYRGNTNRPSGGGGQCNIDYNVDSVGYALCFLNSAGEEAVRLAQYSTFRQAVYDYVEEKFDKDNNVLVQNTTSEMRNRRCACTTSKTY
jgi:hypothetical protein